jgi:outer membrane protein OmpA-like peptidoglycan-associated protein
MKRTSHVREFDPASAAGIAAALAIAIGVAGARPAVAQSVTLDTYRSAETPEDGFALSRPTDRGHLLMAAQLHFDHAWNPLVYETTQGDASTETAAIVEHQLSAQLALAFGLWDRLVVFAGMPFNLLMMGDDVAGQPSADGTTIGDVWFGARGRIWGEADDMFAIGAQVIGTAPTSAAAHDGQRFSGEGFWTVHPEILMELRPGAGIRIVFDVGARFRQLESFGTLDVGHELTWGLGLAVPILAEVLEAHVEAYGTTTFEQFGDREGTPVEMIAGVKWQAIPGLWVGAAIGPGLARGYGAPDIRSILTIGWAQPRPDVAEEPEPEPTDRDGDGLLDDDDDCPDDPEDADGFEDGDGCPDPDNDDDGIPDASDDCPNDPEDHDAFEDGDGCPDPDNDGDGLPDVRDGCPNQAEDFDDFEDENGCPDPDNDGDGVLDGDDRCPLDPGRPEDGGCPRTVQVDRESGEIRILERVEFETGKDVILQRSEAILEEVRGVMAANPAIRRVRVEGHTDDRGRDSTNMDLSRRRAQSVVRWLTEHGIAAARLEGWGCGEVLPVESNRTSAGRQSNRRVEFHILDPAPQSGARNPAGCERSAP